MYTGVEVDQFAADQLSIKMAILSTLRRVVRHVVDGLKRAKTPLVPMVEGPSKAEEANAKRDLIPVIEIFRLDPRAVSPRRTFSELELGWEIYSAEAAVLDVDSSILVRTGLKIVIPETYYGTIITPDNSLFSCSGIVLPGDTGI